MSASEEKTTENHAMVPGSETLKFGPDCICGGFWALTAGECLRQIAAEES